jgi:hypothetical protein
MNTRFAIMVSYWRKPRGKVVHITRMDNGYLTDVLEPREDIWHMPIRWQHKTFIAEWKIYPIEILTVSRDFVACWRFVGSPYLHYESVTHLKGRGIWRYCNVLRGLKGRYLITGVGTNNRRFTHIITDENPIQYNVWKGTLWANQPDGTRIRMGFFTQGDFHV